MNKRMFLLGPAGPINFYVSRDSRRKKISNNQGRADAESRANYHIIIVYQV
jgi:hypothetical protein